MRGRGRGPRGPRHGVRYHYIKRGVSFQPPAHRGIHTAPAETKVCPVCDAVIDSDAKRCPSCDTDLNLFDVDSDGSVDSASVRLPANTNIDSLLDSIAKGKALEGDIFETIKSVAKNGGSADEDILAEPSAAPAPHVAFECPVCGASVDESATTCPGCGTEFAEEVPEEFGCPACGAAVDGTAAACPSCGVTFVAEGPAARAPRPGPPPAPAGEIRGPTLAEVGARLERAKAARAATSPAPAVTDRKSLYKELPRLVNDVKPLLLSARKAGVDIEEPKRLINDAIAAGKRREIDRAVALVSQSKAALERSFTAQIAAALQGIVSDLQRAKSTGSGTAAVLGLLDDAAGCLERGDFIAASEKAGAARAQFEDLAGGFHRAGEAIQRAEALLEDGRTFSLDVREADGFLRQGREALGRREYDNAERLADQAQSSMKRVLPDFLNEEMKRARNKLLDMKVRGGDLTRAIGILKQASIHLKREEYAEAMRYVRMFHRETEKEAGPKVPVPREAGPRPRR